MLECQTKKNHYRSTSMEGHRNWKKKKKKKRKNNSNNNRTQLWMNSIGSHDDPKCLHGTWTDWHALHDIRQGTYERWKIPGLVWGNLSSCNQQSADTSKTWERWVLHDYFPSHSEPTEALSHTKSTICHSDPVFVLLATNSCRKKTLCIQ